MSQRFENTTSTTSAHQDHLEEKWGSGQWAMPGGAPGQQKKTFLLVLNTGRGSQQREIGGIIIGIAAIGDALERISVSEITR